MVSCTTTAFTRVLCSKEAVTVAFSRRTINTSELSTGVRACFFTAGLMFSFLFRKKRVFFLKDVKK